MPDRFAIVGIGECAFDVLRGEYRLGGAPLNVAFHAHQLGRVVSGQGVIVSRIGQDPLGKQMLEQLQAAGMSTTYLQSDPDRPTGRVYVRNRPDGQPDYEIVKDSAWDMLWFDPEDEDLAARCDAVCFGSLAQRDAQARNSIYRFLDATRHGVKMFDVNLREKFYDQRILDRSCERADVVKLNEEELPMVARELAIDGGSADDLAAALIRRYGLQMVAYTRGEQGTRLYTAQNMTDGEPASYPPVQDADSVGAGDACAAAILVGLAMRMPHQAIADLANHAGAYVASQTGATPTLPDEIVQRVGA